MNYDKYRQPQWQNTIIIMPLCFLISCQHGWGIDVGEDDIPVLNMESILWLNCGETFDLQRWYMQGTPI